MKKKSKNNFQKMIAAVVCGCLTMPVVQPVLAEEADWNFWQSYYAQQSAAGVHNDVSNGIIFDDGSSLSTIIDKGQGYFGSYVKDMDQDGMDELVAVGSWYEGGGRDAAKIEVWIYDYENGQVTGTMAYQMYYAGSDSAVMQTSVREATALIHEKADGSNYVMVLEEGRRADAAADYVSSSVIEYDGPGQVKELVNVSSAYKESSSDSLFKGYKEEKAVLGLNDLRSETGGDLLLGTLKRENQSSGTTTIRTEYKSLSSVAGGYSTLSDAARYTQATAPSANANQSTKEDSDAGSWLLDVEGLTSELKLSERKLEYPDLDNNDIWEYSNEDNSIIIYKRKNAWDIVDIQCSSDILSFYSMKVGDTFDEAVKKLGEKCRTTAYEREPDGGFYMMTDTRIPLYVYLDTDQNGIIKSWHIDSNSDHFKADFEPQKLQYYLCMDERHPIVDENGVRWAEFNSQGSTMDGSIGRTANFGTAKNFIAGSQTQGEFACYSYNRGGYDESWDSCQIWYKENDVQRQLFSWEDEIWCQIDYPVIEYQDTNGNWYMIVNTARRVSFSYDECMIFGNNGNGQFDLIADLECSGIEKDETTGELILMTYTHRWGDTAENIFENYEYQNCSIQNGQLIYGE